MRSPRRSPRPAFVALGALAFAATASAQTPWNPLPGPSPYGPPPPPAPGVLDDQRLSGSPLSTTQAPRVPLTQLELRGLLGSGMRQLANLTFSATGTHNGVPASFLSSGRDAGYSLPWLLSFGGEVQFVHGYLLLGAQAAFLMPLYADTPAPPTSAFALGSPAGGQALAEVGIASRTEPVELRGSLQGGWGFFGAGVAGLDATVCRTRSGTGLCRPSAWTQFFVLDVTAELRAHVSAHWWLGAWGSLEILPGIAPRFGVALGYTV